MTTIVELCAKNNANPKVIRAKLRRAVKAGELKIKRGERDTWEATPQALNFLGWSNSGKAPKAAKATAKKSKMSPEARAAFGAKMKALREAKAKKAAA